MQVAADAGISAGPGDLVYLATKREAALPFGDRLPPVDLAIVAFVDVMHASRQGKTHVLRS